MDEVSCLQILVYSETLSVAVQHSFWGVLPIFEDCTTF